jgi:hypothetical protein
MGAPAYVTNSKDKGCAASRFAWKKLAKIHRSLTKIAEFFENLYTIELQAVGFVSPRLEPSAVAFSFSFAPVFHRPCAGRVGYNLLHALSGD